MTGAPFLLRIAAAIGTAAFFSPALAQERPPWDPQYKSGGTAADVLGPDGKIWFPDWTKTGVQGGIPEVRAVTTLRQHGGLPDDGRDDADALNKACEAAAKAGGGAVLLDAGEYHLEAKVVIRGSGVVIRGRGRDRTKVVIRYDGGEGSKTDGVILFTGGGPKGEYRLARDGRRGEMRIALEGAGPKPGDWLKLDAPPTPRWNRLVGNLCRWTPFRLCMVRVEEARGPELRINQPLRIDFPAEDGARAFAMDVIERCGIEDLSIRQEKDRPWIQTVLFRNAVNCWGRGVRVDWSGRNPLYGICVKWMEIRDCEFNESHNRGGGGSGYVGWEQGWDCLMEDVICRKLRHAPNFEWGSSGCVVRNSTFLDSDAQCHSGWCHETLLENCVIRRPTGTGSYGHGYYTTAPFDTSHGPIGPRNVIYNCDFLEVPKDGVVLSGSNENYLILYNRFEVEGRGVVCAGTSFDHVIRGNVFVLRKPHPMVQLHGKIGPGIEVTDNLLFGGNGEVTAGGAAEKSSGNAVRPLPARLPPRPRAPVPSIYEWQRKEAKRGGR